MRGKQKTVRRAVKGVRRAKASEETESGYMQAPYHEDYKGGATLTEKSGPWEVLNVVRDAMRAEHCRFDWLHFYMRYKALTDFEARKALIAEFAPSVKIA